jgi:hypothetical protein
MHYSDKTYIRVSPVNGEHITDPAVGDLGGGHIINGVIQSIGLAHAGSGYTAPPKVERRLPERRAPNLRRN